MKILVTGANGQLGRELRSVASEAAGDSFIFTDVVEADGLDTVYLDITDPAAVELAVDAYNVDAIINCAAYTNVEKAETDHDACNMLNAVAPGILAKAMAKRGGMMVHISTDYVFGGKPYNVPCTEEMEGKPTGEYGRSKLAGENAIKDSGCNYAIVRTSWLYSEWGKNFVKTMLWLTSTKPEISVVFDQVGTPTFAYDLAQAVLAIVEKMKMGAVARETYNYSNEGVCSWYDFAKSIAEMAGHNECKIYPCHSNEFPSAVVRPAYSVLDKTKIKEKVGIKIPYWRDSLQKCITNIKQNS